MSFLCSEIDVIVLPIVQCFLFPLLNMQLMTNMASSLG